ncbi:MAG: iron ABC transporter permease [Bacteroidetes Order II. Incertae sedis bacterium]|nr:iron ABC transporter permease [Bacteroidetes Order II. bacterium]
MRHRFWVLPVLGIGLFGWALLAGSEVIPVQHLWNPNQLTDQQRAILWAIRLPRALSGVLTGAALGVAGLLMQTYFRNPLAGPFELGIQSGASLGVAVVLLTGPGIVSTFSHILAGSLGAGLALFLMLLASQRAGGTASLLILGVLFGYIIGAVVNLLVFFSPADQIRLFSIWGMGSFGGVSPSDLLWFAPIVGGCLLVAWLMAKPLNALMLGITYAQSLGVSVGSVQTSLLVIASVLAGVTTVFCGPIAFLGIAVPHIARLYFQTADHRLLIPGAAVWGSMLALFASNLTLLPGNGQIMPLNALMALLGLPVILWVLFKRTTLTS